MGRRTFNEVYARVRDLQGAFNSHPGAIELPKDHWRTIAWNIAWEAADAASGR